MNQEAPYHARATRSSVGNVPKQSPPAKVGKSVRIRPVLLERVTAVCAVEQLTFNDAVERALEEWVRSYE